MIAHGGSERGASQAHEPRPHRPVDARQIRRTPLLDMSGIVKLFPGVRALDGVDLDVVSGEVHCLLGQNGAGKSTLIKVLSGAHQPDEGTIRWNGEAVRLPIRWPPCAWASPPSTRSSTSSTTSRSPRTSASGHEPDRAGIRPSAVPSATPRRRCCCGSAIRRSRPRPLSGTCPAAGKQIVSMARALSRDVKLMIMDEPSAVLDQGEVARLFHVIRDLTANGVAVIYISHRLEEIRAIGDRVTVLKDGRTVATGLPAKTTPTADVIRLMTGRTIEYVFPPRSEAAVHRRADARCRRASRGRREFEDVSFDVHPGEVVGLAGLVGSGRSEILETVYGARRVESGSVSVDGKALRAGSVSRRRSAPAWACARRSARARRCCSTRPSSTTSRSPPFAASPSAPSCVGHKEDAGGAERDRGPRRAARRSAARRAHAVRRQSAEGRPRPVAAQGLPRAAARRADARCRRRRAKRAVRAHPRARRLRRRRAPGQQRGARGARPVRPGAGRCAMAGSSTTVPRKEIDESDVLGLVMEGSSR